MCSQAAGKDLMVAREGDSLALSQVRPSNWFTAVISPLEGLEMQVRLSLSQKRRPLFVL
jgi:hypothetical protein